MSRKAQYLSESRIRELGAVMEIQRQAMDELKRRHPPGWRPRDQDALRSELAEFFWLDDLLYRLVRMTKRPDRDPPRAVVAWTVRRARHRAPAELGGYN